MNRRDLLIKGLQGILLAGVAPAVCKADLLMPVKQLILPQRDIIVADVSVRGWVKQPMGHRVHLNYAGGSLYLDAVLPGAWFTDERFRAEHAKHLVASRSFRS